MQIAHRSGSDLKNRETTKQKYPSSHWSIFLDLRIQKKILPSDWSNFSVPLFLRFVNPNPGDMIEAANLIWKLMWTTIWEFYVTPSMWLMRIMYVVHALSQIVTTKMEYVEFFIENGSRWKAFLSTFSCSIFSSRLTLHDAAYPLFFQVRRFTLIVFICSRDNPLACKFILGFRDMSSFKITDSLHIHCTKKLHFAIINCKHAYVARNMILCNY